MLRLNSCQKLLVSFVFLKVLLDKRVQSTPQVMITFSEYFSFLLTACIIRGSLVCIDWSYLNFSDKSIANLSEALILIPCNYPNQKKNYKYIHIHSFVYLNCKIHEK